MFSAHFLFFVPFILYLILLDIMFIQTSQHELWKMMYYKELYLYTRATT